MIWSFKNDDHHTANTITAAPAVTIPAGGVFTGIYITTWTSLAQGLGSIAKTDAFFIPPFTAPANKPMPPVPSPSAGEFFGAANSTANAVGSADTGKVVVETSSMAPMATSASASASPAGATKSAALPAAEAGAGTVEAGPSASISKSDSPMNTAAPPAVTPAAQADGASTPAVDPSSMSMSNYGVLGVSGNLQKAKARRRRYVVPSDGFN